MTDSATSKFLTVRQIAESPDYPFTERQVRRWLEHRRTNGLDEAIMRPTPYRLYLDREKLDAWLKEQTEENES